MPDIALIWDPLTADATRWRLALFATVLGMLALLEALRPGPNPPLRRGGRWPAHLGLALIDTTVARLPLPAGAAGAALWAQAQGIGLFNAFDGALPLWLEWTLGLLLLDLAIYWQHRWLHAVPWLWPLHRTHHTDTTLDATSALRFHPLEIVLSLLYKVALAVALGLEPALVLAFEALLSSFALITHADLALPPRLDRALRRVFVTPAMHRIHHSTRIDEQHRNYGFHLSLWDRLFRSYAAEARAQPQGFGVAGTSVTRATGLWALLREPFAGAAPEREPAHDASAGDGH